jgi:hypothetical protein
MSSSANPVTRLALLIAAESAERRREIVECARQLGAREVVQVGSVAAALDWLRDQAADVLVCGEPLRGEPALSLLASVRQVSPATRVLWLPADPARTASPAPPEAPTSRELLLSSLLAFAGAVAVPHPGFSCDVPALSLADVLQLYRQRRGSVSVSISGSAAGWIRLEEGELVHAESGDMVGPPALSRLLGSSPQLVRAEESPFEGPQTISAPFDRVFLDAMDQVERARAVAPAKVEPSRAGGSGGSGGGSGPELDWKLLSEPAPSLRIESPDASSFVSNGRWWAAGGVLFIAVGALVSAMLLSALADAPTRSGGTASPDVSPAASPSAESPLAVAVERLQAGDDPGSARTEPARPPAPSPASSAPLGPDAGDEQR